MLASPPEIFQAQGTPGRTRSNNQDVVLWRRTVCTYPTMPLYNRLGIDSMPGDMPPLHCASPHGQPISVLGTVHSSISYCRCGSKQVGAIASLLRSGRAPCLGSKRRDRLCVGMRSNLGVIDMTRGGYSYEVLVVDCGRRGRARSIVLDKRDS